MKVSTKWLCDINGEPSYARVVGSICIFVNLIVLIFTDLKSVTNCNQLIFACSGFATGVLLWLIELFKEIKNISVKIGDKEYGMKKGV